MIITYYGLGSVKLQFGDTVVGMNPISKESKHKSGRFASDIALISLNHKDWNGADTLSFGDKRPFVISGPGEYEVNDIAILGFSSKSKYDGAERYNTIYLMSLEDMRICHLGALSDKDLSAEVKGHLDDIDILFVPIGGEGIITPEEAYKICVDIGPKIIIPVLTGDEKSLKAFIKEAGVEAPQPAEKLTLKKKDLEGKDGDIVILSSQMG